MRTHRARTAAMKPAGQSIYSMGSLPARPGVVGCLGQRCTGCRPWPGHGGLGPHSYHDMVMTKETGRLCSPAVGAVLRRCKALAMRWYLCGLSQLRRSGGPWFCCSLALSSYVLLPWSDPAFPQVIESDFSKNLAELSLAEDEAETGYQKITQ